MHPCRQKGLCYLPGRLYDLVFGRMFRGLRRRVARTVDEERLLPWLDVCCGTGHQLRSPAGRTSGPGRRSGGPDACEKADDRESGEVACGLDKSFGLVRYAKSRAPRVPFLCGDAARLPFKDRSVRAVTVTFGLHDKGPALRRAMMAEAQRVLAPEGKLIAVDFENPWDARSLFGALFARAIERFAGRAHYRNGREFLRRGGLGAFLRESGFVEVSRRDIAVGSIAVVVARIMEETRPPCDPGTGEGTA